MEVLATAQLFYIDSSLTDKLELEVKFKIPDKFFKIKRVATLCNSWWIGVEDGYKNYDEYQDDLIAWTGNKELIIEEVENMVKEYISGEAKDVKKANKKQLFNKQLTDIGKIEIKVKID